MYGDYEKIGKQTYLRLVAGEEDIRDDFTCSMISEVEVPGLIRLYYAPSEGCDVYKYNVTKYTRLDEFTENYVSFEEMIQIMRSVISTVRETMNYALSPDNIIMSKYSVYLNKNTMEVRMIYVPVKGGCGDAFAGLKNMIIDLIDNAPFREERLAGLSERLHMDIIRNVDELDQEINDLDKSGDVMCAEMPVNTDETKIEKNQEKGKNRWFAKKEKKIKQPKLPKQEKQIKKTSDMVGINVPVF